jgi:hypothetical protein
MPLSWKMPSRSASLIPTISAAQRIASTIYQAMNPARKVSPATRYELSG